MNRRLRGERAEAQARAFLEQRGLVTLARNYRCRWGEIDLVMRHGASLVFVEVRFRSSQQFGGALASIDTPKQRRIARTAAHYLQHSPAPDAPVRFDVVSCLPGHGSQLRLQWIRDAFDVTE